MTGNAATAAQEPPRPGGDDTWSGRRSAALLAGLIAFCLALIVGIWLVTEGLIAQERDRRIAEVQRQNANLARTLQEHAERTLTQVDELALAIVRRFEAEDRQLDLPRLVDTLRVNLAIVHDAAITDDRGTVILSSVPAPAVSLADREHIQYHFRRDTQELYLGKPVLARRTGEWGWPVTRRANNPDGSLLGVVTVLLKPYYFSEFYEQLDLGRDASIALVGRDGVVRTRLQSAADGLGDDISHSELFRRLERAPAGTYIAAPADGVTRIYAYRPIAGFPLISEIGTSLAEALADNLRLARGYRLAAAGTSGLVLLTCAGLGLLIRRESRAAATLERLVAERTASLRESQRQLIESQKMEAIGKLTGGMAHEFNNYLGVIIGSLDLLKMRAEDHPEIASLADSALNGALRAAELTDSLLSFSRRRPLLPQRVDLPRQLTSLAALLRRTIGEDVVLATSFAPDTWPAFLDAAQLDNAVLNLTANAREAMPGGGTLNLSTYNRGIDDTATPWPADVPPGDYAVIEVADTGAGMSPEVLAQAFEPFFSTKPVGHGTGLGLSMVLGFVKQSGGHVVIDSTLDLGTVVRLYLPRDTSDTGADAGNGPHPTR